MHFTLWAFFPQHSASVSRLLLFLSIIKQTSKKKGSISIVKIIVFPPKRSTEFKQTMLVIKEYFGVWFLVLFLGGGVWVFFLGGGVVWFRVWWFFSFPIVPFCKPPLKGFRYEHKC